MAPHAPLTPVGLSAAPFPFIGLTKLSSLLLPGSSSPPPAAAAYRERLCIPCWVPRPHEFIARLEEPLRDCSRASRPQRVIPQVWKAETPTVVVVVVAPRQMRESALGFCMLYGVVLVHQSRSLVPCRSVARDAFPPHKYCTFNLQETIPDVRRATT